MIDPDMTPDEIADAIDVDVDVDVDELSDADTDAVAGGRRRHA